MKICALITLFKPDSQKVKKSISEILSYVEKVYLLANSSLSDDFFNMKNIEVIQNEKNIGLSMAVNAGLEKAQSEGFVLAVLFDQDSFLTKDSFKIMYSQYKAETLDKKVMCIGPSLNVRGNSIATPSWSLNRTVKCGKDIDSVKNIITSGMLLNVSEAVKIGGFDSQFPVDFCDFYFCWKSLYNGYAVLKSKKAFIHHEIGNSCMKAGSHTIHFHSPYRNYFLVRDTLNICLRKKETPFCIRCRYLFFLLPRMILFVVVLDKRLERMKMYWLGFKDFVLKKSDFGSVAYILQSESIQKHEAQNE